MQLLPDYTTHCSPTKFEREFRTEFRGAGFYLSKSDTMLVIPNPPDGTAQNWHVDQPEGTLYFCHVWNCNFSDTIFSKLPIPTRQDAR